MLHIIKQFMFGFTMSIKLNNSPEWTGWWETIPKSSTDVIISPEVKDSNEAKEVKSNTMADLKELYNEVEVAKLEAADFFIRIEYSYTFIAGPLVISSFHSHSIPAISILPFLVPLPLGISKVFIKATLLLPISLARYLSSSS